MPTSIYMQYAYKKTNILRSKKTMLEIYRGGRRNGHHFPKTLLLHIATLAYKNQNFYDRKLKKSTKSSICHNLFDDFLWQNNWRIVLWLAAPTSAHSSTAQPRPTISTQLQNTRTKYKVQPKNTNTTAQPTISTQLHKKNKVQQTCYVLNTSTRKAQQHSHDQLSQHNFATQEQRTK